MLKTMHSKNYGEMSAKAADHIAEHILSAKTQLSAAFSGGTSVQGLLKELASRKMNWSAVNVFVSDERLMVPLTGKDSNFRMLDEALLSKAEGVHKFAFDMGKGLHEYNQKFMAVTKGRLDLVALGVGEDGHIASLFPNSPELKNGDIGYIPVENAPKPPARRVSLSSEAIARAENIILIFASDSKKDAYKKFSDPSTAISDCPAKIALKAKHVFVHTAFGG